ncbi:MAG: ATP-dependent Clp protease ATP-binding subunit [Nitrospira sp.]|nr:ATP-dependent Clp protease ATP-binding subunit [Nitrospira sp.]
MADPARIAHLRGLEAHLRANIRGQDHLLPRIAASFARGAIGIVSPDRPRGSLLFVGPTGTGKTETFLRATEYVFGPGHLVSFDMSEYQDRSAVNKLLGEDRGDMGLMGRALTAVKSGGVLFDEVEKAHPLVLDLFLQILWQGRITVATGEVFRFGGYFVGFTSNIGAAEAMRMEHLRLASVEQTTLRRVEQELRPELVGRIDEKLVFARLGPDVQREICALEVARETARLRAVGFDLEVSHEALEFLIREGFHSLHGARPLRKVVERHLQDAVVRDLFATGCGCGRIMKTEGARRLMVVQP